MKGPTVYIVCTLSLVFIFFYFFLTYNLHAGTFPFVNQETAQSELSVKLIRMQDKIDSRRTYKNKCARPEKLIERTIRCA